VIEDGPPGGNLAPLKEKPGQQMTGQIERRPAFILTVDTTLTAGKFTLSLKNPSKSAISSGPKRGTRIANTKLRVFLE
jgi:hypothetical protein